MRRIKCWLKTGGLTIAFAMVLGLVLCSTAFAQGENAPTFDIVILIDTSGSTGAASGVDVNGNGIVGRTPRKKIVITLFGIGAPTGGVPTSTDPGDSILTAEVLAAKKHIAQLDSLASRVAIISFNGDYLPGTDISGDKTFLANPATPDAVLEQHLTHDFRLASDALEKIERKGPAGGTNMAEGIQLAVQELAAQPVSGSPPSREAQKIILLISDGLPTFPVGSATTADPEDKQAALIAAHEAGKHGIKVHTFALGKEPLREPETVKEIARITGGQFTPLPVPGEIIKVLPSINLSKP